jgi:magnesium chelatase subunit H
MKRIVLIAGFESFNPNLYRKAAELAVSQCQGLEVKVFSNNTFL